jgi:hypothetical protein
VATNFTLEGTVLQLNLPVRSGLIYTAYSRGWDSINVTIQDLSSCLGGQNTTKAAVLGCAENVPLVATS